MQTGLISFCGKTALNIKSNDAKTELNDKLQVLGIDILKKHFERFGKESQKKMSQNQHLLSLKSNGNPYLLFLTRFNSVDTCMFVDKKIQHGYFLPRMIIDRLSFESSLFDDTVIDCEMVKIDEGNWVLLFNDIFVYKSKRLNQLSLVKRLHILHKILKFKYFPIPNQKYSIQVKKYFDTSRTDDVLSFKDSLKYSSRGMQFKPNKNKFIYILLNFDDSLVTDVKRVKYSSTNKFLERAPDEPDFNDKNYNKKSNESNSNESKSNESKFKESKSKESKFNESKSKECTEYDINFKESQLNSVKVSPTTCPSQGVIKRFHLQKTNRPDVYKLFDSDTELGIASVSTMKTSKMLRHVFDDVNLNEKIKFECEFSERFGKWVPLAPVVT